jgi:hypothetical protein
LATDNLGRLRWRGCRSSECDRLGKRVSPGTLGFKSKVNRSTRRSLCRTHDIFSGMNELTRWEEKTLGPCFIVFSKVLFTFPTVLAVRGTSGQGGRVKSRKGGRNHDRGRRDVGDWKRHIMRCRDTGEPVFPDRWLQRLAARLLEPRTQVVDRGFDLLGPGACLPLGSHPPKKDKRACKNMFLLASEACRDRECHLRLSLSSGIVSIIPREKGLHKRRRKTSSVMDTGHSSEK